MIMHISYTKTVKQEKIQTNDDIDDDDDSVL